MDRFGLFYYKINYPCKPIFIANEEYQLLSNTKNISNLTLTGVKNKLIGFDISDFENQTKLTINQSIDSSAASIYVKNTSEKRKITKSITFLKLRRNFVCSHD